MSVIKKIPNLFSFLRVNCERGHFDYAGDSPSAAERDGEEDIENDKPEQSSGAEGGA